MSYPIIHITKQQPLTFTLTLNNPRFNLKSDVEALLAKISIVPKRSLLGRDMFAYGCVASSWEQMDSFIEVLRKLDRNTVVIDSSQDKDITLFAIGYGDITGFAKQGPEEITSDQILKIN